MLPTHITKQYTHACPSVMSTFHPTYKQDLTASTHVNPSPSPQQSEQPSNKASNRSQPILTNVSNLSETTDSDSSLFIIEGGNVTGFNYTMRIGTIRMEAAVGIGAGVGGCLLLAAIFSLAVWCKSKHGEREELIVKSINFHV
jgi:hypothetical protein